MSSKNSKEGEPQVLKPLKVLTQAELEGVELIKSQIETDRRPCFVMGRIRAIWEERKREATKSTEPYPGQHLRRNAIAYFNRLIEKGAAHEAALVKRRRDGGRTVYEMEILRLASMFRYADIPKRFNDLDLLAFAEGYNDQRIFAIQRRRELREQTTAEAESRG